jgi:hypothetical protein
LGLSLFYIEFKVLGIDFLLLDKCLDLFLVEPLESFTLIPLADFNFTTCNIIDPDAMLLSLFLFRNYIYTIDPGADILTPIRPLENPLAVLFIVFIFLGPKLIF